MIFKLKLVVENLDGNNTIINVNGFCINNDTIVTTHVGNPIETCFLIEDEKETELKIIIDSQWNELLFLEKPEHLIFDNVLSASSLNKDYTHFYSDKEKLDVLTVEFLKFNMYDNFKLPYIKCRNVDNITKKIGMPVITVKNGKKYIVGLISQISISLNDVYIIPYYIILKTLSKNNNNDIFTINEQNITKIGKYRVVNNEIYHSSLKIKVPLNTFMLLEGEDNKNVIINNNINVIMEKTKLTLKNDNKLITNKQNKYLITYRFLELVNYYKPNKLNKIMKKLEENPNSYVSI
jgi:hypothetical protein